jgi:hypothetical protein
MVKKLFLTVALASFLLGGVAVGDPTPAQASHSGCMKAAKAKYPSDRKARHAYKKECKAHYKAWKKAHKKHHWFGK